MAFFRALVLAVLAAAPAPAAAGPAFSQDLEFIRRPSLPGEENRPALAVLIKSPKDSGAGPWPALIVLGGVETGAGALDLIEPRAAVTLATFDYPYEGPRRFAFPRTLLDAPAVKAAVARTSADLSLAHGLLRERPGVDPRRACVVGASFGAPFALRAAADDPRIPCVVLVHGFADVKGTAAARMRQLWRGKLGPLARPSAWLLSRLLWLYLDAPTPEDDAGRLRPGQRVLLIEATGDTVIPAASRQLLWRRLQASPARTRRVALEGDHLGGARTKETISRAAKIVERWLEEESP